MLDGDGGSDPGEGVQGYGGGNGWWKGKGASRDENSQLLVSGGGIAGQSDTPQVRINSIFVYFFWDGRLRGF